jgi:hypothetical protein
MVIFKIQIEKQTALQFTNMDRMSLVSTLLELARQYF